MKWILALTMSLLALSACSSSGKNHPSAFTAHERKAMRLQATDAPPPVISEKAYYGNISN